MKTAVCALAAGVAMFCQALAQEVPPLTQAMERPPYEFFEYDSTPTVDTEILTTEVLSESGVCIQDITFASPVDGRVTAFLIQPPEDPERSEVSGTPPHAGIVFLHWGMGNRTEFIHEASIYARAGAVSILLDAPWARPEPWRQASEGQIKTPELVRDVYVQTVVDVRRAVDLLLERDDVDPGRLAYVGHSFGATWGGVVAAIEKRFRTVVLMGGLPSICDLEPLGSPLYDDYVATVRGFLSEDELAVYKETLSPIQPIRFVGDSSPTSVFMQFGEFDWWIPRQAAEAYYAAAGEPKRAAWYPCSHELAGPNIFSDRAAWLSDAIGLELPEGPHAE